ncbi:MAG TPA: hypothetical protein VMT38_13840 [Terracidiphilus sp.]|nr:hypothetical protein [Terracidiphilus sp.]
MIRRYKFAAFFLALAVSVTAQDIPQQLHGKWLIKRIVPTTTISCWSFKEAQRIVGTEIDYSANRLRWKDRVASDPLVEVSELSAVEFQQEYSGGGANDSQVNFGQLGIRSHSVTRIKLTHPDIKPIWGSYEIPGEEVLVKDKNTIIFSVCNVYFEARRESVSRASTK